MVQFSHSAYGPLTETRAAYKKDLFAIIMLVEDQLSLQHSATLFNV